MSLQRGENIRGWEGVTKDLGTNDDDRKAGQASVICILFAVVVTGLVALMIASTDIPTVAKAVMLLGFLFGMLLLMNGLYSRMTGRAATGYAGSAKVPAKPAAAASAPPVTPAAKPAPAPAAEPEPAPAPAAEVVAEIGRRPEALAAARDGKGDDLTKIKGVGPKLATLCNTLGFYHFDQIAAWTADEVAWVDENLEGFKGRVTRDDWVSQAKILASGGETEFSARQ
ncbi:MAG: NADH:ubiquinone oxidoreductase [Pseudomonadota bacterium]